MDIEAGEPAGCPECGEPVTREAPYFATLGKLADMRFTEAAQEYYRNRGKYRAETVRVFACGNKVVTGSDPKQKEDS
jgi:hypothetical protein